MPNKIITTADISKVHKLASRAPTAPRRRRRRFSLLTLAHQKSALLCCVVVVRVTFFSLLLREKSSWIFTRLARPQPRVPAHNNRNPCAAVVVSQARDRRFRIEISRKSRRKNGACCDNQQDEEEEEEKGEGEGKEQITEEEPVCEFVCAFVFLSVCGGTASASSSSSASARE